MKNTLTQTKQMVAMFARSALVLAVILNGMAAINPARADYDRGYDNDYSERHEQADHERDNWREREWHEREWREHEEEAHRWHRHPHEAEPSVIYAPPSVIYAPPQPPQGINLIIPLNIR